MEIIPGLHIIQSRAVNCYLIVDEEGLTLIDTGLPRNQNKIHQYLNRIGYQANDIARIIVTHADGDHYGCLKELQQTSGAKICTSAEEAPAIRKGELSRPMKLTGLMKLLFDLTYPIFQPEPVDVDIILEADQVIPTFGGLHVIPTPGHTPGHLSLYATQHNVLLIGDSLRATPKGELIASRGANTWDEQIAWQSVQAQAALEANIVCPGHGPVIYNASGKFPTY